MAKPHWLAPRGATKTPAVVVSFDTETAAETDDQGQVLRLRCWDAIVRVRAGQGDHRGGTVARSGETAVELAETLESATGLTGEAWCFAHNLGFDLTVTSLPLVLAARGWGPDFMHLGDESCCFSMSTEGRRLVITDSWSWVRAPLGSIAKDIGMRKPRLPADDDTPQAWHRRCAHDVRILDRALTGLMDWWETADLGSFALTGSACGWRSLRAHVAPKAILVGTEEDRTPYERRALYGGRKEAWRGGRTE